MKRIPKNLLMVLALITIHQVAVCQSSFGVKAGLNYANQVTVLHPPQSTGSQKQQKKPAFAYQAGAFYKTPLHGNFSFSTEANFSVVGSKTGYIFEDQAANPDPVLQYLTDEIGYLELPVILQYNLHKLYVGAGPAIAFKLYSKMKGYGNTDYFRAIDFSGNLLSGYKMTKQWDINFKYSYGLLDIRKKPSLLETRNRCLSLSLLYSFK